MSERLVIRNVKFVNGQTADIAVENGMIAEIAQGGSLPGSDGFDGTGLYVSSGWIDMHVHAFPEFDPYGDEIDEIGVKQGVTTIIDAGSCGADRIGELQASAAAANTRCFAFLNISHIGLQRVDELSQLEWIDKEKVREAVTLYPDFIVGLKARISRSVVKDSGIRPLQLARELSEENGLHLMVHIGSAPPQIEEVIPLLAKGDVVTHYLNGKPNNLFDEAGKPLSVLVDAVKRGVHLDVGHGSASFSFRVAEHAKQNGIQPDTISTDIYRGNRLNGPVYSMANVLSKFLYLGYSLEEVIHAVTVKAADWLGRPELGRIQVGDDANLTLFAVKQEPIVLVDSEGEERTADQYIEAKGAVIHGSFFTC
ncbi:amidohydrolase/deacetylase family metallohydrolase [Paenibacillus jiagnxiensis]|uniref:amidohydrolase/deacetylase family metallohydrolase n=1 Tax=Paenibacillus jiagnxiensis TaxID=3228926 RepID=UPI0033B840F9